MPRHVRKGDTVIITSGSNKGLTGEVLRVITDKDQVVLKGINLRTKHMRPTRINPQGGIITKEAPIHISNVSPIGDDGKPSRVRFEIRPDGSKMRVAVRGNKELGLVRSADAKKGAAEKTADKSSKKPAKK